MVSQVERARLQKTFNKSSFNLDIASVFSPDLKASTADRYVYLSDGVLYFHFESQDDRAMNSGPIFQLLVLELRNNLDLAKLINVVHLGCLDGRWEIPVVKDQACSPRQ